MSGPDQKTKGGPGRSEVVLGFGPLIPGSPLATVFQSQNRLARLQCKFRFDLEINKTTGSTAIYYYNIFSLIEELYTAYNMRNLSKINSESWSRTSITPYLASDFSIFNGYFRSEHLVIETIRAIVIHPKTW